MGTFSQLGQCAKPSCHSRHGKELSDGFDDLEEEITVGSSEAVEESPSGVNSVTTVRNQFVRIFRAVN